MTCRDTKFMYLCSSIVMWTDCSKPIAPIVFNVYSMFVYYCSDSPSLVLCYIGLIICVFIGDFSHSFLQLFTHTFHSLPTLICSPPKVLIMNKRTIMLDSSLEPVPSCSILPSDSTGQYHMMEHPNPKHIAHTNYCWTPISYRFCLIRQSWTLQYIINRKCVFSPKNFEIK